MDNLTFFIKGCQAGAYKKKEWAFSVFCVAEHPDVSTYQASKHYPFKVYHQDGRPCYYNQDVSPDAESGFTPIKLKGKPIHLEPIVYPDETMTIYPGDIPNHKSGNIETTPGKFFFNWYCLVHAIGDRWPYVNDDKVDPSDLSTEIAKVIIDDDPKADPKAIQVSMYKLMLSNFGAFSGFTGINTPSATEYTMTPAPGIRELRDKLLKEYEGQLHDPIKVVELEKKLIDYDKAYIAQDPHEGFYISGKSINVVRKKLHGIQGIQTRMDESKPAVLVTGSLSEPMNIDQFPALVDGLRSGAYFRGAMTALGGEGVKFIYRIYSAASIIKEDCKTQLGLHRYIPPKGGKYYIGVYYQTSKGWELITEQNASSLEGKWITTRSPGFCKADPSGRSYCQLCMGEKMRGRSNSLATYGAAVLSVMNTRFMKAMHVDATASAEINFDLAIT